MLLSNIQKLLNGNIQATDFKKDIQTEISEYKNKIGKKRGSSLPVYLVDDIEFEFTETHMQQLEILYSTGKLDKIEVSNIADALHLSEKAIMDEELFDQLEHYVIN